jgi:light-harvesting protein B-800-850 alpha chain
MNQGRIWCVVNPTVGLPLFLGSVAVTSLLVHYSVLSNTTWFAGFLNGHVKPKAASVETVPSVAKLSDGSSGYVVSVAPAAGPANGSAQSFVITVAPRAAATAQADADGAPGRLPDAVALAASPTPK